MNYIIMEDIQEENEYVEVNINDIKQKIPKKEDIINTARELG